MRQTGCVFCAIEPDQVIDENDYAFLIRDRYPVKPLHSLVIPKRCVSDQLALEPAEILAVQDLVVRATDAIRALDPTVAGFNVGSNIGAVAGQKVFHAHIHVIPRRAGDSAPPPGAA
jgi:ATP adenylyltransferase